VPNLKLTVNGNFAVGDGKMRLNWRLTDTIHLAASDISVYSKRISKKLILKLYTTFKIWHGIPCTWRKRLEDIFNILYHLQVFTV
jgi:hypothetical protein